MLFEVNENLMFKMSWRVDVMTHTTKSIFRTDFLFASNLFSSWTIDLCWFHRKLQTNSNKWSQLSKTCLHLLCCCSRNYLTVNYAGWTYELIILWCYLFIILVLFNQNNNVFDKNKILNFVICNNSIIFLISL